MPYEKITYDEIQQVVQRLYNKALGELNLKPEQAFAYVQDESELLHNDDPVTNVVLQTAIYKWGAVHGVKLSKESVYAQDMLEVLSDACRKFDLLSEAEKGGLGVKFELVAAEISAVKELYL
ncbi:MULTISPECIES: hypothetical protein [unclassified Pseudomonas]|jgi:hypothetical protein|uniref:hypothetical protein n=1 Tax=unclassified Pseudomonas TaxID=196821 RepID=UPI00096BA38B|nr:MULTISPECIES: hypothetical protein [unclassified Pseudomonas]MDY0836681.1 hypothetical protein [Pseudomonas sp. SED1]OLY74450.1 hypothetical protein AU074_26245 [Pseudomonas sp. ATCC PTA-122608]